MPLKAELFLKEKESTTDVGNNIHDSQHNYGVWKNPDEKIYDSIHIKSTDNDWNRNQFSSCLGNRDGVGRGEHPTRGKRKEGLPWGMQKLLGVMHMSLSSSWWLFHACTNVSKLFKLCTSNMCSLLHFNFTPIKVFFKGRDGMIITS